jgi:hypothetical protein
VQINSENVLLNSPRVQTLYSRYSTLSSRSSSPIWKTFFIKQSDLRQNGVPIGKNMFIGRMQLTNELAPIVYDQHGKRFILLFNNQNYESFEYLSDENRKLFWQQTSNGTIPVNAWKIDNHYIVTVTRFGVTYLGTVKQPNEKFRFIESFNPTETDDFDILVSAASSIQ